MWEDNKKGKCPRRHNKQTNNNDNYDNNYKIVRYSGPFFKSTGEELRQMEQRTRKQIMMYKALNLRDNIDRLYISRKEGERGLASIEDSVDISIQGLKEYIKESKERLIIVARNSTDSIMINRTVLLRGQHSPLITSPILKQLFKCPNMFLSFSKSVVFFFFLCREDNVSCNQ